MESFKERRERKAAEMAALVAPHLTPELSAELTKLADALKAITKGHENRPWAQIAGWMEANEWIQGHFDTVITND